MVQVFSNNGFRDDPCPEPYEFEISKAFLKKHGRDKTDEVCQQIMLRFKEADETKPAFTFETKHNITVDASVRDVLKELANQRGFSVSSLVREALHSHLLKNAEPVRHMTLTPVTVLLCLSPFEEKLLKEWRLGNSSGFNTFLSTIASVTESLPQADLVGLFPRGRGLLYPDKEFLEQFLHSTKVYGYPAPSLFRQILAFMDRPFDPDRVQDRYLDWLTGGYAHELSL